MTTLFGLDEQLLPTEADVQFYAEHGWYITRPIFTAQELAAAIEGSERFYGGEVDDLGNPLSETFRARGVPHGMRKNDYASLVNRELTALVRKPILAAIAARLAGASEIRLWHDQLLYKPVDDPARKCNVGWHTDRGYWKTCSSARMLTAWIPFHPCNEAMGTITMVDGSNLWPDNTAGLDFFSNDLEGLEARFNTGGNSVTKVPMNLELGQVSLHNCLTIHGSGPNRSEQPRRSIAVHMQDETNHWIETRLPDGSLAKHHNDTLVRQVDGRPDYTDPLFCPRLYPE